jgi:hypothetical protein
MGLFGRGKGFSDAPELLSDGEPVDEDDGDQCEYEFELLRHRR